MAEHSLRFASLSTQMFLRWVNLEMKIYVASVKGLLFLICDKHCAGSCLFCQAKAAHSRSTHH